MSRSTFLVRARFSALACGVICLLVSASAHAQTATVTPETGMFGVARTNPRSTQHMSLTVRANESHDSEMQTSTSLLAGLRYDRNRNTRSMFVNADAGVARYFGNHAITALTSAVSAGFTTSLGRHTTVQFEQTARRSPFYVAELLGAEAGVALFHQQTHAFTTSAIVTRSIGRRSSLAVNYALDRSDAGVMQFAGQSIGASVGYRLTRYATARAGYTRRVGDYQGEIATMARPRIHDLDIGIDYSRPLSLTRRTTLTFATGSSVLPVGGQMHYRATGSASLARQFGRTWSAAIDYGRNVEFLDLMPEPVLSDAVGAAVRGRMSRRIDLRASARVSKGSVGFSRDTGDRYASAAGSLHLSVALTRFVAAYAEDTYYRHNYGQNALLPLAFGHRAHRHDARIGVMVWAPLLN